jgi:hypothetical protein
VHVRRGAVTRDRLQRRQADGTHPLLATFPEYTHRFCVKIDIGYVERCEFAQSQAAAVEQFHNRDIAQRHPSRRRLAFALARWGRKKFFNLLAREDQRKLLLDLGQLHLAHRIAAQTFSSCQKLIKRP